jgi:hypothetical protein
MPNARNANNGWLWALAALFLVLFVWGAEEVAVMPLQTGEVYPEYSSLRADPLGAQALYESLAVLPEIAVSRLYKERTVLDAQTALLVLGVNPESWPDSSDEVFAGYERLLQKGGRLVIAFLPARPPRSQDTKAADGTKQDVVKEKWNVHLAYRRQDGFNDSNSGRPPRRSAVYFQAGSPWRVVTERDDEATVVERPLANGTVVLVADSYPLSNEGLRAARDSTSLVRLIGPVRSVVFDENHFGVSESGSVTTLMRKYHLEGALAILSIVVGLFVWRSASSFLPPQESVRDATVAGRDAQEGMTALLRRSVPEPELLDACFREWNRSSPAAHQAERVEAEIERWAGKEPVKAYRAVMKSLETK